METDRALRLADQQEAVAAAQVRETLPGDELPGRPRGARLGALAELGVQPWAFRGDRLRQIRLVGLWRDHRRDRGVALDREPDRPAPVADRDVDVQVADVQHLRIHDAVSC